MRGCRCLVVSLAVLVAAGVAMSAEGKKVLRATQVSAPPVIDGDLSDAVWREAGVSGGFVNEESGASASQPTLVYALSDADHLYLAFRCAEPSTDQMLARATRDNASVWGDDCVEVNLDPTGGSQQIYQIAVNSIGTKEFELRGYGHLDASPIQAAARVGRDQWTVEVALPFAAVGIVRSPQVEMPWRVNFERLRTIGGEEDDDWQYTAGDWANPDIYGQVIVPGGAIVVEAFGHGPLGVGRPAMGFARLSGRSTGPSDLRITINDLTAEEQVASQRVLLGAGATTSAPLDFIPSKSGEHRYRWSLHDNTSGALLYSLERVVKVEKAVTAYRFYHSKELLVEADTRAWGELPADATVEFQLVRAGSDSPALTLVGKRLPEQNIAEGCFKCEGLPGGEYEVRAVAKNRTGRTLSAVLTEALTWPKDLSWPNAPADVKVLNNFAAELLNAQPPSSNEQDYTFFNPRDGWVFIASTAQVGPGGEVRVALADGAGEVAVIAQGSDAPKVSEAMRWLRAGEHRLRVSCKQPCTLQRLIVRAVPELIFCKFQYDPHVTPYGPYDWDFLSRHVLPHVNTIVGSGAEEQLAHARAWREAGGKWIIESPLPGISGDKVTVDDTYSAWLQRVRPADYSYDGIIVDEFFGGESPNYPVWTEAMLRLYQNPALKGFAFYPYCGSMYEGQASTEFIRTVMNKGGRFAWERYLGEQRTESEARKFLQSTLTEETVQWQKAVPGCERNMIACFGYLCAPPESLNLNPSVDYRAWMDMQFRWLANDPTFFGLYGVMEYTCGYADEESVRWAARLYRHYCIEGNTQPLCQDPYVLAHLDNPDFEDGLKGWNFEPAEEGSISTGSMEGYSWLQGRYPQTEEGNTFLIMRRSAKRPNVVRQTIKGLEPGRLYSLKMFTGDHQDLSVKQEHAVSLELQGVELIPDNCFQHVFANCYGHYSGRYDASRSAWMNFYWRVFRAKSSEAVLRISDWASEAEPGGPIGQELMFNFVEVQPYFAE